MYPTTNMQKIENTEIQIPFNQNENQEKPLWEKTPLKDGATLLSCICVEMMQIQMGMHSIWNYLRLVAHELLQNISPLCFSLFPSTLSYSALLWNKMHSNIIEHVFLLVAWV